MAWITRPPPRIAAIGLVPLIIAGCSMLPHKHDEMCREIAKFANSVEGQSVHSVELFTDWGGVFSDDKDVLAEKACKHDELASGKELCQYLLEHTSTEFAAINFRRALSCLPGAQELAGPMDSQVEYLNGKITSYSAKGARPDVQVSIEFSTGASNQAPSLKIGAQRIQSAQ